MGYSKKNMTVWFSSIILKFISEENLVGPQHLLAFPVTAGESSQTG